MTVRCRTYQSDSLGKTHWCEYPDPSGENCGTDPSAIITAVCAFLTVLEQRQLVAISEGVSQYGMRYVSVYYRKED